MLDLSSSPIVTVCVANYNGADVIESCLQSILAQRDAPEFEILVHDDCSSDDSLDRIRSFPCARLIESEENRGFCVANNRMAIQARGEYLLLLNNDATLLPDALAQLFATAQRRSDDPVLSLPQYELGSGELLDRGMLLDPFYYPVPNLDVDRNEVAMVTGACLWISRRLWERIGGFPEWMESIAEDMFLCCYARSLGHPVLVPNASGYRHRVGASFGGGKVVDNRLRSTHRRRALSERNKTYVLFVFTPDPLGFLMLPLHLTLLALEGICLMLLYRRVSVWTGIYLPAILAPLRCFSRLRMTRKQVKLGRKISGSQYLEHFVWAPRKVSLLLQHGLPSLSE